MSICKRFVAATAISAKITIWRHKVIGDIIMNSPKKDCSPRDKTDEIIQDQNGNPSRGKNHHGEVPCI